MPIFFCIMEFRNTSRSMPHIRRLSLQRRYTSFFVDCIFKSVSRCNNNDECHRRFHTLMNISQVVLTRESPTLYKHRSSFKSLTTNQPETSIKKEETHFYLAERKLLIDDVLTVPSFSFWHGKCTHKDDQHVYRRDSQLLALQKH